jgi:hypothetical protein
MKGPCVLFKIAARDIPFFFILECSIALAPLSLLPHLQNLSKCCALRTIPLELLSVLLFKHRGDSRVHHIRFHFWD